MNEEFDPLKHRDNYEEKSKKVEGLSSEITGEKTDEELATLIEERKIALAELQAEFDRALGMAHEDNKDLDLLREEMGIIKESIDSLNERQDGITGRIEVQPNEGVSERLNSELVNWEATALEVAERRIQEAVLQKEIIEKLDVLLKSPQFERIRYGSLGEGGAFQRVVARNETIGRLNNNLFVFSKIMKESTGLRHPGAEMYLRINIEGEKLFEGFESPENKLDQATESVLSESVPKLTRGEFDILQITGDIKNYKEFLAELDKIGLRPLNPREMAVVLAERSAAIDYWGSAVISMGSGYRTHMWIESGDTSFSVSKETEEEYVDRRIDHGSTAPILFTLKS
jgi:hypothetical protein